MAKRNIPMDEEYDIDMSSTEAVLAKLPGNTDVADGFYKQFKFSLRPWLEVGITFILILNDSVTWNLHV